MWRNTLLHFNRNVFKILKISGVIALSGLLGIFFVNSLASAQQADGDDDGDGLLNSWEINGYDADGNGTIDVDLPALGANYQRKDVFIEIDWMQGASCNQKPAPEAISRIITSFAQAPLSNPDGSTGITLHVDIGQGGGFTGGNALNCNSALQWPNGFQTLKAANFNSARQPIFHYNIWGIQYDAGSGVTTSSGIAELPGDDFLVSLGAFPGGNGTVDQQAGTFMHEMGHNFGLRHGGSDNVNYKPNHLSVMSYSFQLAGVIFNGATGTFDYQRFGIDSLNERSLNETLGLNASGDLSAYGTVWFCAPLQNQRTTTAADGAIDWNCDGQTTDGVRTSINRDALRNTLQATPNQWASLIFNGGAIGSGVTGRRSVLENFRLLPARETIIEDLSAPELLEIERRVREALP
jgi:Metallo-peptidase family M12B Reprolysin-like